MDTVTWSHAGAWGDYNLDGVLDHYAGNRDPNSISDSPNRLFASLNGDANYANLAGIHSADDDQGLAYGVVFTDYDKDGWPDIYVANDKFLTHNTLLHNLNGFTFEDVSDSESTGMYIDGMGIAPGDFTGNGYEDLYMTNTEQSSPDFGGNIMVRNNGDATFDEVGDTLGIRVYKTGWGTSMADFDCDGDLDLFVVNSGATANSPFKLNNLFINQGDGTFMEDTTTAISQSYVSSYGSSVGDINNDGYPDILVMNDRTDNLNIWQNNGGSNNWIKFTLEGVVSNRSAIGSWVELYDEGSVQYRYSRCGTSFGCQDGTAIMFGLGQSPMVDSVIVRWPGGLISTFYNLPADSSYHFTEPAVITSTAQSVFEQMRIYPNPTSNSINVVGLTEQSTLVIRDMLGNEISYITWTNSAQRTTADLSDLPTGVYILEVREGNTAKTKKIVKL